MMDFATIAEFIIPVCLISLVVVLIGVQFLPKEHTDRGNTNGLS